MFALYALGMGLLTIWASYNEYKNFKQRKQLPSATRPIVTQILTLIEIDPEGWAFNHKKPQPNDKVSYPYWAYLDSNDKNTRSESIQITFNFEMTDIRHIYWPAIIKLTKSERMILMKAFEDMVATKIESSSTKLLLGGYDELS